MNRFKITPPHRTDKPRVETSKSIYIKSLSKSKASNELTCELQIDEKNEIIKTRIELMVESIATFNFEKEVIDDRCDAYVWGLLFFAMQNGYNIKSDVPISESMYYNLEYLFIDSLVHANDNLHRVQLKINTISDVQTTGNIVATGISCGVDSLYTIKNNQYGESHKVNMLTFFNAGAAHFAGDRTLRTHLVNERLQLAQSFANAYMYSLLFVESDIHLLIQKYTPYSHVDMHTYMMLFCTYHLQGSISHYYYSSGYSLNEFELPVHNRVGENDASHYDLLLLSAASIGNLHYHSTGAEVTRFEKTRFLVDYEPAQKYLNVCVQSLENCCTCGKCLRTIFSLDALGALEKFSAVFDIKKFNSRRSFWLQEMYKAATYEHDIMMQEILPYFDNEITLKMKVRTFLSYIKSKLFR